MATCSLKPRNALLLCREFTLKDGKPVLGPDSLSRAKKAAELYHAGEIHTIWLTSRYGARVADIDCPFVDEETVYMTDLLCDELERWDVPRTALVRYRDAMNTAGEIDSAVEQLARDDTVLTFRLIANRAHGIRGKAIGLTRGWNLVVEPSDYRVPFREWVSEILGTVVCLLHHGPQASRRTPSD